MTDEPARITRVAAYAVCVDEADRVLLGRLAQGATRDRDGWWTLPGGDIDQAPIVDVVELALGRIGLRPLD